MKYSIAFVFCFTFLVSYSQNATRITFKEAVTIGLKNNVDVNQEQNNLIVSNVQKKSSMINYIPIIPDINFSVDAGTFRGNAFIQQTGEVVTGRSDFFGAGLRTSTVLFSGMNRYYTYQQRKHALESQTYNVKWTKETVISHVATQYLTCLLNQELLTIAQNNLELQERQLNRLIAQVELGSVAEVEKINQDFQVKNAELEVIRAQTNLRNSIAELTRILQLDPATTIELVEPDWSLDVLPDESMNLDELVEIAMKNRADIKQAVEQTEANELQFKASRGLYYPRLTAFFNYNSQYNYIHGGMNREFEDQLLTDNLQNTYGVSLNIPILNGLETRANVVQSKVNYENQKLINEDLINSAKISVINSYQDYKEALAAFNASQAQLDAAQTSYNLEQERFNLGASDLIQLTESNQNYVQAQADYAQAYYTLVFQDIFLEYALGTLTPEDIPD